jgi:quinoprotein glucose dehydrogenase
LWDYDLPSPPNLTTLSIGGEQRDVVVQVSKQGFVFVLDRDTGEPVFPIEERSVPASWMPDESASATQPFPSKPEPLVPQGFDTGQLTNISAEAHNYIMRTVDSLDFGNIYTPPNKKGIVQLPGFRGGAEWSGAAIDKNGVMYIGVNNIANIVQLEELPASDELPGSIGEKKAGGLIFQQNCSACHGADRKGNGPYPPLIDIAKRLDEQKVRNIILKGRGNMPSFAQLSDAQRNALVTFLFDLKSNRKYSGEIRSNIAGESTAKKYKIKGYVQLRDSAGYPGTRPPWGMLKAIDLNTGKLKWSRPLGEYPELIKKGIPATGTQLFGGAVVTEGGLVFIGATQDEKFRVIDSKSGKTLKEFQLPAGGYATPATYMANGKQYVVIAAGGGGFQLTKSGDAYVAFTVREE